MWSLTLHAVLAELAGLCVSYFFILNISVLLSIDENEKYYA